MNSLFNQLMGGNAGAGLAGAIMQMLPGIRQNPLGALTSAGYNIPNNLANPAQIIQHLMQTGQINQGQLDYAQRMAQMLGVK